MPYPASFSVRPQHAQPDENTGYNTQLAFVIPGSKAAERNARRKKGSISALQTVPNRRWEASGSIHPQYSAPHGLMTPKTPDSFLMDVDSRYHYRLGQEDMFAVPLIPRDCSNGFYPDYYANHPVVQILPASCRLPRHQFIHQSNIGANPDHISLTEQK
ncbi:hypothetical protein BYT27DRAFT_7252906 [Phlegmacium glaucopus]|nr:hypothetical protein BYT27DRAFT_7252906 [Phlegmacium glaucopus]